MWKFQIYWQQITALSFPDFLKNVNFLCISRSWVQSEEEAILWRKGFPTKDFATVDSRIPNVDAHQQQAEKYKYKIQIQTKTQQNTKGLCNSWVENSKCERTSAASRNTNVKYKYKQIQNKIQKDFATVESRIPNADPHQQQAEIQI